ncbi:MAG: AarF/ABC1/UbiB kinase family protein [Anaerolineae bacterium]|nr:AarF/ABC1/UbiB kinase family protein [Anaerolineae bacterium]
MDYRHEGGHADRFRESFANEPYLHIPRVYWEYSTHRMMVQERIVGIKIDQREALVAAGHDPHQIALNAARFLIKEIFEDGFFHADPHPGNLLIMEGGVIGLIDFGMVGWLSPRDRLNLLRLYAGVIKLQDEAVMDTLINMGITHGEFERDALRRDVVRLLRRYYGMPLREIRATRIINELVPIAFRHNLQLPTDLWLLSKTLVILEGVGQGLDPSFDIFSVSEPYINRLRWHILKPEYWSQPINKGIGDWAEFLLRAPEASTDILRQLRQSELEIKLHHSNLDDALNRLDKIASRVSVSITIAAIIIGLSFLIPIVAAGGSTWVLAIMLAAFIVSTGLGLWLLYSVLRSGV